MTQALIWCVYVAGYTYGNLAGDNAGGGAEIFLTKISDIPALTGDFDASGQLDAADIDLLSRAVRDGPFDPVFDLNEDMTLTEEDRVVWVQDIFGTLFGDANLNQEVQFEDFVALAVAFGGTGGWAAGDFDGDRIVQFPDFVLLADNFGNSAVQSTLTEVPEPTGFALAIFVGLALVRVLRSVASE